MPEVASWVELARSQRQQGLISLVRTFGPEVAIQELGLPPCEVWAAQVLLRQRPEAAEEELDSLPFLPFCQSGLAPLLALSPHQQQRLFGYTTANLTREARQVRLEELLRRDLGLPMVEKVCWLTGERFGSRRSWNEARALGLLAQSYFLPLPELRQRMVEAGGVAALAALLHPEGQGLPLATRVVTLCLLNPPPRNHAAWPDLLRRSSPLERYMVISRLTGKLDFSWSQRQEHLVQLLAQHYGVAADTLLAAHALEDLGHLVERLERDGPEGLKQVMLRPLAAFRPALAQPMQDQVAFPCWVDCKYDGIRLLLHKELDSLGNLRVAAYTRRRNDWSELLPGLGPLLQSLQAYSLILDGELHGRVLDPDGVSRPASVYEVHECLRGELRLPLRYVAFDLLYWNGQDCTHLPFQQRRSLLEKVLNLRQGSAQLPLPLELAQGSMATDKEQLNRLYQQFRQQGHEGCMIKDLQAAYPLALRSPAWQKRKPLESVDLVLTAAYWGEGSRPGARLFDSYSIAARHQGGWREVGTVAGVDQRLTTQLAQEVFRAQLLTGRSLIRRSPRGEAPGVELRPYLVVTVGYEDVLWDRSSGEISLRSPRVLGLRSGEMPLEESTPWNDLEHLALRSRLG